MDNLGKEDSEIGHTFLDSSSGQCGGQVGKIKVDGGSDCSNEQGGFSSAPVVLEALTLERG